MYKDRTELYPIYMRSLWGKTGESFKLLRWTCIPGAEK